MERGKEGGSGREIWGRGLNIEGRGFKGLEFKGMEGREIERVSEWEKDLREGEGVGGRDLR